MTKVLNLDEFQTEKKLVLKGKEHAVRSMTVEEFIAGDDWDERFKKADGKGQVEMLIDMLLRYIPTCNRADLVGLEVGKLSVLVNFVRGLDAAADAAATPQGNG